MRADAAEILESLGAARRFADPGGPTKARLMAARGALPIPPAQIAGVLFALTLDPEPEVAELASQSLSALPAPVLDAALTGDVHPALLDHLAQQFLEDERQLEKIALNAATSDETICLLARQPYARIVDIIAQNQVRILRCSDLVDALGDNPATGQATIDRILHFLGVERGEMEEPPPDTPEEVPEPPPPVSEEGAPVDLDDPSELPPELLLDDDGDPDKDEVDEAEHEEKVMSLLAMLQDMNVMQKIKLARLGNREARGLLVRERNKLVATAAIRSPKMTDSEVVSYAKSRNLHDEVIRIICHNREWTRNYQVKHALATNPKAPQSAAIKFLNYLTDRDLRSIMRSRDVPGPVSQQARRILVRKGKA